jgi:hypothetical protein
MKKHSVFVTFLSVAACALAIGSREASAQPTRPGVAGTLPVASKASIGTSGDLTARANILADPKWFHWGGTPVLGDDGQYHMFYDRWSRNNARLFRGWLFESQSPHAVSSTPEGPYKFQDIANQGAGDKPAGRWDAFDSHNSYCVRMPDPDSGGRLRYYLYFIANKDTNNQFDDWYNHIVNQQIGVAVADSPNGPWTRSVQPACSPAAPILGYVVNPAVCRLPGGKYLMMLKGRAANQTSSTADNMGNYRIGWALADKPTGPFTIQPTVLFDAPGAVFEDPCVFIWNGLVYVAVKDVNGGVSTVPGISWVYGTIGADGYTITWTVPGQPGQPAASSSYSISARQIKWADNSITTLSNLERPFILQDATGKPTHLFCAASASTAGNGAAIIAPLAPPPGVGSANVTFNVCIPLNP